MNTLLLRRFYVAALGAIVSGGMSMSAMAGGPNCEQRLTHVDAEGSSSGQISAADHAAQADKRFDAMDANGDDRITGTEIDASHGAESALWAKQRLSANAKIEQLDSDDDGALTRAEYASGSQKMFRKLDLDKDGVLTAAEMQMGSMTAHDLH